MAYLIGTDEAGYGPNLGPLLISVTVWEVPDHVGHDDLFERLAHVIASRLADRKTGTVPRIVVSDSKALYASGKGLRHLERGLWAALWQLGHRPKSWQDMWSVLAPEALDAMATIPWYADFDRPAPLDADAAEIAPLASSLDAGLAMAGVRIVAIRSRAVFAEEFNQLVDRFGSKGEALSRETLALAARAMSTLPPGPVAILCDKHGGRNRYAPLLAEQFPDDFIEIRGEGRLESEYRFGPADRRVTARFRAKAEACLPVALASMTSKYLREAAMHAFNDYWRRHVPNLRPTAGYPEDAKRFRADTDDMRKQLGIADRVFWRTR